jgi:hypothetical protein
VILISSIDDETLMDQLQTIIKTSIHCVCVCVFCRSRFTHNDAKQ